MKLFGFDLFNREPKVMWDFAQFGLVKQSGNTQYFELTTAAQAPAKDVAKKEEKKVFLTPKALYEMSALNDRKFTIRRDEKYINEAIESCEAKMNLMPQEPKRRRGRGEPEPLQFLGGVAHGRNEIKSIIERLENRRKIDSWKDMLAKYPHTTSKLLNDVMKENGHLSFQKADVFVPDFPREATKAMQEYNRACEKLCGKTSVFYVVAAQEDFEQKNNRRDPILLAQSPFGFFWQILGAWDEEMVYLDEL